METPLSFWHDTLEPGHSLTPRPTLPGDRDADVAIVGAGFTGLWTAAVGRELVAHFAAIKRTEWQRFTDAVTDWELAQYLWFC